MLIIPMESRCHLSGVFRTLLLLFLCCGLGSGLYAQHGAGSFDTENGIRLTTGKSALPYSYTILLDEKVEPTDWQAYVGQLCTPLTTVVFDEKDNTLTVSVETRMRPEWTLEDWNDHLTQLHQQAAKSPKM